LSNIVFCGGRPAVREVFVGGRAVIEDGRHPLQEEIVAGFQAVQARLWSAP
jgi:cytosine/adenosine deaminase-related metal-dependent hydrolase